MRIKLHHRFDGPEDAPVVVFSNSLSSDLSMWDPQAAALAQKYRLLRYDTRGHGASEVPPGPYGLEELGGDVLDLLNELGLERIHFCGLSLGGLTAQWLGLHAPGRLNKLILCNTGAKIGAVDLWNARIGQARAEGMGSLAEATLERWFTPGYRAAEPEQIEKIRRMILRTPPEGYAACCAVLRDADLRSVIHQIRTPTLVITGSSDPATPASLGQFLAQEVPGAKYAELASAHLSNIEVAEAFNQSLLDFLAS